MYKCNKCTKNFKYKSDFERHKNRKTPCTLAKNVSKNFSCTECGKTFTTKRSLTRHIRNYCHSKTNSQDFPAENHTSTVASRTNESFVCKYCEKEFTRKDTMTRHIKKYCKNKKNTDLEKEKIFQKLLLEMDEMKQKVSDYDKIKNRLAELENESKVTQVNNTNNITNNVTNNLNIQLVAFGKENKESMKNSEIFQILRKGFSSVPELVKAIHFNEERPENHNVYISNMRDNYVMVFDGDKWELRDRKETLENIFDDGRGFLIVRHNDMKEKYNDQQKKLAKKFDRFDYDIDHCPEKKEEILNDIKLILYNKRDLPLKQKKVLSQ